MTETPLALRLRELRGSKTQQQMGLALGVSAALVSAWENAQAVPPKPRLLAYAAYHAPEGTDILLDELVQLGIPAEDIDVGVIDDHVIAMFRLPIPSRGLIELIEALCSAYGENLEVHQTRDGWLTFSR